jgi:hypothetical protein
MPLQSCPAFVFVSNVMLRSPTIVPLSNMDAPSEMERCEYLCKFHLLSADDDTCL